MEKCLQRVLAALNFKLKLSASLKFATEQKRNMNTHITTAPSEKPTRPFDLRIETAEDVNPLELIGNASLALHHHMAPADGAFDLDSEPAQEG